MPRFVLDSVSVMTSKPMRSADSSAMVRQHPLTAIDSPERRSGHAAGSVRRRKSGRWATPRMGTVFSMMPVNMLWAKYRAAHFAKPRSTLRICLSYDGLRDDESSDDLSLGDGARALAG